MSRSLTVLWPGIGGRVLGAWALMGGLVACGDDPGIDPATVSVLRSMIDDVKAELGKGAEIASSHVASLEYFPPSSGCRPQYRIRASYDPELRFEPDSTSELSLGPVTHASRSGPRRATSFLPPRGLDEETGVWEGELDYQGVRSEQRTLRRTFRLSSLQAGPASPTVACVPQTWDPVEDALAIAWPKLTGRVTAVGETWTGLPVGSKCQQVACVDPETGGGGPANHHRACVAPFWTNTFAGLLEIEGERFAVVTSRWNAASIFATSQALLSLEHGRPVYVRFELDYGFGQPLADGGIGPVRRSWTATAVDRCPGSLATP